MSQEKQARREKHEGKNAPGNIKKSNSTAAGSPDGVMITNQEKMAIAANMQIGGKMMNSPDPVIQAQVAQSSANVNLSGRKGMPNPYDDANIMSPAMADVFPQPASGMQAFGPGVGANGNNIIGMQQQPIDAEDLMLAQTYNARNFTTEMSPMGMIGQAATPAPAAVPSAMTEQTATTIPLQGVPSADFGGSGVNMKTGKRGK